MRRFKLSQIPIPRKRPAEKAISKGKKENSTQGRLTREEMRGSGEKRFDKTYYSMLQGWK